MEALGPFLPLCRRLGRIAAELASSPSVERVEAEFLGRIAERDTRLLTLSVLNGLLAGRTEEEINLVNAPALAEERGIQVSERREATARDYADLVRITVVCDDERCRVVGTTLGHLHRPHLLEAWGQRFNLQIDDPHLALFRYSDVPGMVGRVGTRLGESGVNISAAAVGRHAPGEPGTDLAVMAVTTDSPVPADVVAEIAGSEGFVSARAIPLD
jgi:D-3-phosphoglycerate dehydrogenase